MDEIITNTNDATWWTNIQLIQVAPTGGRIFKAKGATWWPNFQIIQVARPGGQNFHKCKWHHLVAYFHQLQVVSHGGRILMKYKNIFPRNIANQICEKYTFPEKK